jgi:hypothetical protein
MIIWAVMDDDGHLVTLFMDESDARSYAGTQRGWYVVERFAQ